MIMIDLYDVESLISFVAIMVVMLTVSAVFTIMLARMFGRALDRMTKLAKVYEDRAKLIRKEIELTSPGEEESK